MRVNWYGDKKVKKKKRKKKGQIKIFRYFDLKDMIHDGHGDEIMDFAVGFCKKIK